MATQKPLVIVSGDIRQLSSSDTLTTASLPANTLVTAIPFTIRTDGLPITTGIKGTIEVPFDMTVTGWTLEADQSGSIVIDVKSATYSGYPTTSSIAGTEKPTLSSAQKNQDLTLSSWTTSITAGDILEFVVDSASTVTRISLTLRGTRT